MRWLTKKIFFDLLGWKLEGGFDPSVKKCVVIVAPHTSWYDFLIGALVRKILDTDMDYVAKKELFRPPFGWYFRWMGGTPLDRTPGRKKVDAIAKIFRKREQFRLAIAPEGTRKKTLRWKTGFYFIAKAANVPIIMVAFDYGKKTVKISEAFYPGNDTSEDFEKIKEFYKGVKGRIREYT